MTSYPDDSVLAVWTDRTMGQNKGKVATGIKTDRIISVTHVITTTPQDRACHS